MAAASACGGLRSLFDNPLPPENPTLIESLSSWNQMKPIEPTSIAEIFGELYFQEKPAEHLDLDVDVVVVADDHSPQLPTPIPPPPALDQTTPQLELKDINGQMRESTSTLDCLLGLSTNRYQCNAKNKSTTTTTTGVFSTKNSESLLMCTEGLGSESSDDVDDLMEHGDDWRNCWGKLDMGRRRSTLMLPNRIFNGCTRRRGSASWPVMKRAKEEFPPPISSIGRSGKPSVCLRSYKEDGRFVLREVRIPCQEWLRASREDGRLKLHFVHHEPGGIIKEGINEEGEEEEEEKEEEEVILEGGINIEEKN